MDHSNTPSVAAGFTIVEGTWGHTMTKLRNMFKQLNDDDLHFVAGHEQALVARLQAKLGKSEQEVKRLITTL